MSVHIQDIATLRDINLETEEGSEIHMLVARRASLQENAEPMLEEALACWQAMIDAILAGPIDTTANAKVSTG